MNKFGRPEEEDFQTVYDIIVEIVEQASGLVAAREQGKQYSRQTDRFL